MWEKQSLTFTLLNSQGMTDDDHEVLKSGRPKLNIIERYESASGIRWVQTDKIPICDKNGIPVGLIGFAQDITERKQAEEALKAERQRLHDVLETMPIMVCLLTPDYHVAFANRAFREKFGESHGRHCYEYCFGKKEPCDFCETYRVLKTGKPHHWQVTTPDGASVIDVYDFPFTDVDGSPMILEMDIDITERKQAEEALKRNEANLNAPSKWLTWKLVSECSRKCASVVCGNLSHVGIAESTPLTSGILWLAFFGGSRACGPIVAGSFGWTAIRYSTPYRSEGGSKDGCTNAPTLSSTQKETLKLQSVRYKTSPSASKLKRRLERSVNTWKA